MVTLPFWRKWWELWGKGGTVSHLVVKHLSGSMLGLDCGMDWWPWGEKGNWQTKEAAYVAVWAKAAGA